MQAQYAVLLVLDEITLTMGNSATSVNAHKNSGEGG